MIKIFIDGNEGTTGLKINGKLNNRKDIKLLILDEKHRKDLSARKDYINKSDITFLCLPDEAARESVMLIENEKTKIIDASTAHRISEGWTYGFPELNKDFRKNIAESKRVSVPGCHASGFLAIIYPLVISNVLSKDYPIACHSITGYSGGGKKMIAQYQNAEKSYLLDSPRQYALEQNHKHLREMQKYGLLNHAPLFNPIVADFISGMAFTIPLYMRLLEKVKSVNGIYELFRDYYSNQKLLTVEKINGEMIAANALRNTDKMKIYVGGNDERPLIIALYDNLGKGASGAAVQCMNIMSGLDEIIGLEQ